MIFKIWNRNFLEISKKLNFLNLKFFENSEISKSSGQYTYEISKFPARFQKFIFFQNLQNFLISNFENRFSPWKINIFWSGFFFLQGMVMYFPFLSTTCTSVNNRDFRTGYSEFLYQKPLILPVFKLFSPWFSCRLQ